MNTRELLEKAAKAAGEITESWYGNEAYLDGVLQRWNPLENDGDAFRLALTLGIQIGDPHQYKKALAETNGRLPFAEYWEPFVDGDYFAATRLAVTRAAAAMWDARQENGDD